jgi:protein-disulfide isomerase
MAAWCAAEQNKFWEMHDRIFATQDRWNTQATSRPQRVLGELAEQIGVNMDQYNACMSSNKYAGQIQSNVDVGIQQAVGSTPTFVIGNRKISSSLPYDELKRHIDEVTAEVRAAAATKSPNTKSPATKAKSP